MPYAIPVRAPVDVCTFVDELGDGEMGALDIVSASGVELGAIFVQEARVCWVAARGMAGRLHALLGASAGLDERSIGRHVERCRGRGLVLADELVERGVVTSAGLRDVIARHSAECLARLCRDGATGQWVPRTTSYAPRFLLSTAELLSRAGAAAHAVEAAAFTASTQDDLEVYALGGWAAGFVRTPGRAGPTPVAVAGAHPTNSLEVLRSGKWAAGALDVGGVLAEGRPHVCIRASDVDPDRTLCAVRTESGFVVAETDSDGRARLVRERRALLIDDSGVVS